MIYYVLPIVNGVMEVVGGSVARVVIVEVTSAAVIVKFISEIDVDIASDTVVTGSETVVFVVVFNISVDDMGNVFMEVDISEVSTNKNHHAVIVLYIQLI